MAYIGISLTSYYYIKSNKTQEYISVPHSKKKLVKNIAFIFEDNEKVLKQIQSKEFEIDQLPELIRKYNISNN
jgi:Na+/phosphate symporter